MLVFEGVLVGKGVEFHSFVLGVCWGHNLANDLTILVSHNLSTGKVSMSVCINLNIAITINILYII